MGYAYKFRYHWGLITSLSVGQPKKKKASVPCSQRTKIDRCDKVMSRVSPSTKSSRHRSTMYHSPAMPPDICKFTSYSKKVNLHAEKQIWIVLAVNRNKAILPLQCCDTSRKPILHIPEHTSTKIN